MEKNIHNHDLKYGEITTDCIYSLPLANRILFIFAYIICDI